MTTIKIEYGSQAPVLKKNLLIFGCDYFVERKSSEVNFWNDMVVQLSGSFREIVVVSVNYRPVRIEHSGNNVTIYNFPPKYFFKWQRKGADKDYSGHKFNKMPMSIVYKTMSFLSYLPRLMDIIDRHNIGVVHYMRVFGLLNDRLIKKRPDLIYTITVPTHIDRGFPVHQPYHVIKNLSFADFDKIIVTSEATASRLRKLKVERDQIEVVPWATDAFENERAQGRRTMDDERDAKRMVLWAGPLQGTGMHDFQLAYRIAKRVTSLVDGYSFVFAFKPDKVLKNVKLSDTGRIRVLETDPASFYELMGSADLFLSPFVNRRRTLAPPLTWIEMMQHEVPVITTPVDGAEEIIIHGETGYLFATEEEAVELLTTLKDSNLAVVSQAARQYVDDRYNVNKIAKSYLGIWGELQRDKHVEKSPIN